MNHGNEYKDQGFYFQLSKIGIMAKREMKKHLYLLSPMSNKNFEIAFIIEKEMSIIKNNTIHIKHSFDEIIPIFLLLIQFYNIYLLKLHFKIFLHTQIYLHHIYILMKQE